ncbi:hypothetical protein H7142_01675 [Candidatus Saccharibacteria bacterium]|nr:hypothetical protein [Candidatus Saccharibacteria bacterium]
MKKIQLRAKATKILLGTGYISLIFEWLWVVVVGVPPLIKTGAFDILMNPTDTSTTISTETVAISPLTTIAVGAITMILLAFTVVVLIRIPKAIVETGERIVHQAAEVIVPVVTHHKPLPAKKRRMLSRRVMCSIQISASVLPALISLILPANEELSRPIIITVTLWLAALCLLSFLAAWATAPAVVTSRTQSRASRG